MQLPLNAMFLNYGFNTSKENKICAVFANPADFAGTVLPTRMDCCRIRVFSLRCDIIISGDLKSLRWINFQMKVYSQVA